MSHRNHPTMILSGSCLCGKVRFTVPSDSFEPQMAHCHCIDCRKFHGAAFSTFGETKMLRWEDGSDVMLTTYVHPENGSKRQFCKECGSSMTFQGKASEKVEIALATLDTPWRGAGCSYFLLEQSWLVRDGEAG